MEGGVIAMSWGTRNLSNYCGTCKYWKGKRKVQPVSDTIHVIFPSSSEKGICKLAKRPFSASQVRCRNHIAVSK